jgi:ketosteroid isomerase-like protein
MMRIAPLALCGALIGAAACSGRSGSQFDRSDVESITKVIEQLRVAFNAKDSGKAAALYSPTGVVMPPNRALMRGRQFVQQYYDDRFAEGASDLEIEAADISGQGTLAYASGDYRLNLVPKDGQKRRDRGKFLWVFRENNGVWTLEYVIFSSDFVAPPNA